MLQLISSIQVVVAAIATLLVALAYRAYKSGEWIAKLKDRVDAIDAFENETRKMVVGMGPETLPLRMKGVEDRMDRAGMHMSDLTDAVQTMPDRIAQRCQSKELAQELERARLSDSANMWAAIKRVEESYMQRRRE